MSNMASASGPSTTVESLSRKDVVQHHHQEQVKATTDDEDLHDISAMGREQLFVRKFSFWSVLGISVCVSGTWEGITASTAQAFYSGGPTALLYGYIAAALGGIFIAASLAELASAWPTSGGLYHWIGALVGPKYKPFVGFVTGTLILGTGWIGIASAAFGVAFQTQAYVMLTYEDYEPERWHTVLIIWMTLFLTVVLNFAGQKVSHYLNLAGMAIHIIGYLTIMIVLLACTQEKQSAEFVFTGFQNYSGWSDGMAWCIGLLTSVYGFASVETAAYFAEETKHASRNIPRAMLWNTVANGIMTLPFIIVLLFCIGDLDSIIADPIGSMSPTTLIYVNATGNVGAGIVMNCFSTIIAFISCFDAINAGSRSLFAMARDGLFPLFFAQVNPRFDLPLNAMALVSVPPALLALIYLGNETAFYGFISGILISTMMLYTLPIGMLLLKKLWGSAPRGPWRMDTWIGGIVNTAACLWACFLMVVLSFPSNYPVTVDNMNYGIVLVGGVLVLCITGWLVRGRNSGYEGPPTETVSDDAIVS